MADTRSSSSEASGGGLLAWVWGCFHPPPRYDVEPWLTRTSRAEMSSGTQRSGGHGFLGEGRLKLPGQVWELRILPSFPSYPTKNRCSDSVWENARKSQTSFYQTSATSPKGVSKRMVLRMASSFLRWPDWSKSIRRFARIAHFARIISGFQNWTFLCESLFGAHSRESLERYGNSFFWPRVSAERSLGWSFRFGGGEFGAKFLAKFAAKFSGLVCWDIQSKENLQQKLQPQIPMTPHSKTGEIWEKNFMTRFWRGTLGKLFSANRFARIAPIRVANRLAI